MNAVLEKLNKSLYFDLFGVCIIIFSAYKSHYLFSHLDINQWGYIASLLPFGIISTGNAILSLMSTRLTGRLNKWGNIIGVINVVISGTIDYILGNKGAIFTYPITFVVSAYAIETWQKYEANKANTISNKTRLYILSIAFILLSIVMSFGLNYLAYGGYSNLYLLTSITFTISLTANLLNILKLSNQWWFWTLYNFVQFLKAITQGNFANVGKYIYYIINATTAILIWKRTEHISNETDKN